MEPKLGPNEPYFFEKFFPASYHLTYHSPITQYPGSFNLTKGELERKSRLSKDEFLVYMDVAGFAPDEITVKTINETVYVEGRQGKRTGNAVPRHFQRDFRLPEFFDSDNVCATISEDGILRLKASPSSTKKFRHLEEIRAADTTIRHGRK